MNVAVIPLGASLTVDKNFESFVDNGIWEGHLHTSWLEEPAYTIVDCDDDELSDAQFECMRKVCNLDSRTLEELKLWLFKECQVQNYGSRIDRQIDTPDQLWQLLEQQTINIPPENAITSKCLFAISFECPWDEEHGISVLFDSTGTPTKIAGYGDHF